MSRIRIWQWPNLLALDAALIAVCWQATISGISVTSAAAAVLALSVWLTYMADRLFDVANRPAEQLRSARHQFAKQHSPAIWRIWWGVLLIDVITALTCLSHPALINGFILLALCLAYTCLNQKLSKRFFPKEICVALIFAGGTVVFMAGSIPWAAMFTFGLLCLCNCLTIAQREHEVDDVLQVRSLSSIRGLVVVAFILSGAAASLFSPIILLPWAALIMLTWRQHRIPVEVFRVLMDSALLLGPLVAWVS